MSEALVNDISDASKLKEADFWKPVENNKVYCYLCPRYCKIGENQTGFCFIRTNIGGKLYSLGYGHPAAINIDPIEKKPLFHFLPGTKIFSMGTAGCNMGCKFCQNWDISKAKADQVNSRELSPEAVVSLATTYKCPSLAYTYNEPTIWAEYARDIAKIARQHGLKNVMVTNGYVTEEALKSVYEYIDAANVDLKAFTEKFYSKITLSHLEPVLKTLKTLKHETSVWVEITNLMIPTLNDAQEETRELAQWILDSLGDEVPLHFTAFHPDYKLLDKPNTPRETLERAREIAMDIGLKYVYVGNIFSDSANTYCPNCKKLLIQRSWHNILKFNLKGNTCSCGQVIPIYLN
jgi:pyruvate formate lyase activating enzyme